MFKMRGLVETDADLLRGDGLDNDRLLLDPGGLLDAWVKTGVRRWRRDIGKTTSYGLRW